MSFEDLSDEQLAALVTQARKTVNRPRLGGLQAAGLGALDGLSFGFADEAVGLVSREGKNRLRDLYSTAKEDQGGAFFAGQVGGGIGSSFLPGFGVGGLLAKGAARAGGLLGKLTGTTAIANGAGKAVFGVDNLVGRFAGSTLGKAAAAGAAQGGLSGFGSAEGDFSERIGSTAAGAQSGALLGAGGGALGKGAGYLAQRGGPVAENGLRSIGHLLAGKDAPINTARAESVLFRRLEADNVSPEILARAARNKSGKTKVLLDIAREEGGENLAGLLEQAALQSGPGRNLVGQEARRRADAQYSAVRDAVYTATKGKKRAPETIADLRAQQIERAAPLYQAVQKTVIAPSPQLRALLQRPVFKAAVARAREIGENRGEDLSALGLGPNGELGDFVSLGLIDRVKQAADEYVQSGRVQSGIGAQSNRAYADAIDAFRAEVDDLVEGAGHGTLYKDARAAFGSEAELQNAFELGTNVLNNRSHSEFLVAAAKLTDAQREAAAAGLRDTLLERAGAKTDGGNIFQHLLGNPNVRERIKAVLGTRPSTYLQGRIRQQAQGLSNIAAINPRTGSATARRLAEGENVDAELGDVAARVLSDIAGGNLIGAGAAGLKSALGNLVRKEQLTAREAEYLLSEGLRKLQTTGEDPIIERFRAYRASKRPPKAYEQTFGARLTQGLAGANVRNDAVQPY